MIYNYVTFEKIPVFIFGLLLCFYVSFCSQKIFMFLINLSLLIISNNQGNVMVIMKDERNDYFTLNIIE